MPVPASPAASHAGVTATIALGSPAAAKASAAAAVAAATADIPALGDFKMAAYGRYQCECGGGGVLLLGARLSRLSATLQLTHQVPPHPHCSAAADVLEFLQAPLTAAFSSKKTAGCFFWDVGLIKPSMHGCAGFHPIAAQPPRCSPAERYSRPCCAPWRAQVITTRLPLHCPTRSSRWGQAVATLFSRGHPPTPSWAPSGYSSLHRCAAASSNCSSAIGPKRYSSL